MGRGGINMGNESSLCLSLREHLPSAPAWSSKGTVAVSLRQSQPGQRSGARLWPEGRSQEMGERVWL